MRSSNFGKPWIALIQNADPFFGLSSAMASATIFCDLVCGLARRPHGDTRVLR